MHTKLSLDDARPAARAWSAALLALALAPTSVRAEVVAKAASQAPVVDGRLDDVVWESTSPVKLEHVVGSEGKPSVGTDARIAFDDAWLYVAIRCEEPKIAEIVKNKLPGRNNNSATYDDSVEIFVHPLKRTTYFHFGVSVGNAQRQQLITPRNMFPSWCVPWRSETLVEEGSWTAEMAIPLYSLGRAGNRLGKVTLNITRNKRTQPVEYVSLVPLPGKGGRSAYYAPEAFAPLKGLEDRVLKPAFAPVIVRAGRLRPYYKKGSRNLYAFTVEITNLNGELAGDAELVIEDKNLLSGKTWTYAKTLHLDRGTQGELLIEVPVDRRVARAARVALRNETDIRCGWREVEGMSALQILTAYPDLSYYSGESSGKLTVGTIFNSSEFRDDGLSLGVCIRDTAGRAVREETFRQIENHGVIIEFEPATWPSGTYPVEARLLDAGGAAMASAETKIDIRPAPPPGTRNITKVDQEQMCLTLNGKPFFPLGFMSLAEFGEVDVLDESSLALKRQGILDRFREGAFNMIFDWAPSPSRTGRSRTRRNIPWSEKHDRLVAKDIEQKLQGYARAEEAGLYVVTRALSLVTVDFNNAKYLRKDLPLIREKMPGIIEKYKRAANLMAWANIDELGPRILDIGSEYGDMLRRIDPYHVVVSSARGLLPPMFAASDVFSIHAYWGPERYDGQNRLASWIQGGQKTAKLLRRPIFATPQGQRLQYCRELTPNERLCGIFLPIIEGAKGMFFFTYPYPYEIVHPVTWRTLCYASKLIHLLSPVLLTNPPPQQIETRIVDELVDPFLPELPREESLFDPSYAINRGPGKEHMPSVQALVHDHPAGGEIILLANSRAAPLRVRIRLSSLGPETQVKHLYLKRDYPVREGIFEDILEPFAVRFYSTVNSTRKRRGAIAMAVTAQKGKLTARNVTHYNPDDKTVVHGGYERIVNEFVWSPVDDEEGAAIELAPRGKNLIKNSSFEQYAIPWLPDYWNHGWLARRWFKIFFGQNSSEKHDGKYSIRLRKFTHKIHHMPTICHKFWTGFDKETDYVLSAWLKTDVPDTQCLLSIVKERDQYDERAGLSRVFTTGTEWQRIQWPLRIEENGKLSGTQLLCIGIRNIGTPAGEDSNLWVDAVQIERGAEATPYERDSYRAPPLDPKWLTDAVFDEIPGSL